MLIFEGMRDVTSDCTFRMRQIQPNTSGKKISDPRMYPSGSASPTINESTKPIFRSV